ncbi:hypothetical protein N8987_04090 [Crocinitomix sp.]|nr:hypothetical protein [Crocinitomix sp.]
MKTIQSAVIGPLVQNKELPNWWKSDPFNIPLIEIELAATFMDYNPQEDAMFLKEADQALSNFLAINAFYKFEIAKHVYANFQAFCNYVSKSDLPAELGSAQALNILSFVDPTAIFVARRKVNDKDIYIIMTCECAWDKVHGLQLVFRQGKKLTRVSDQDGHLTTADAFGLDDSDDELLAAF